MSASLVRAHWQNLNERHGKPVGSGVLHGRAWFYIGRVCINPEWKLGGFRCGAGVSMGEDGPCFSLQIPLIGSFYLGLRGIVPWRIAHRFDWYDLSVRVFDGSIWVNLWCDDSCSSMREPWWHRHRRRWTFHVLDRLLGRLNNVCTPLTEERVEIPMPEGIYPATVKMEHVVWGRLLWFKKRFTRAEVVPDKPIPHPGKGENAWDCGEDATYSFGTPADSVHEAIGKVVSSVMRKRLRYGGRAWRPEAARGGQ